MTQDFDDVFITLSPCAGVLLRWLLNRERPGKAQEVYLEDFVTETRRRNGKSYSLRWSQAALNELIEMDLVEISKRYTSRIFKLVVRDLKSIRSR